MASAQYVDDSWELFKQIVLTAARNLSQRGDQRLINPYSSLPEGAGSRPWRIGLFGYMANQAYITARCLRRLGQDVDVVVQSNAIDQHFLNQPFWEDVAVEVPDSTQSQAAPEGWNPPAYIRVIPYDLDVQVQYQNRLSAVPEVIALYKDLTGKTLPDDTALLLAQWMGHWNYIRAMNDYDVVQLATWPIVLGAFCPKPYIAFPLGGELYITAFEENVQGLLCRAGFRAASHIAVAETDYPIYLDRLATTAPRTFMPLLVDTEVYCEGVEHHLRAEWQARVGGSRYLLAVCRQSWDWKGSDRLIRAFAEFFHDQGREWRLLLQAWGDDLDRSRALVTDLGIDAVTAWLPMCSKPLLRARQRAADVVADQFVMEGYGTSVLESMAAGKAVLMSPVPNGSEHHFRAGPPPLIGAKTIEDIKNALQRLNNEAFRSKAGRKSRRWVQEEHGYQNSSGRYISMFEDACQWNTIERSKPVASSIDPVETTINLIAQFHRKRRNEIWETWHRVLPFAEQITDRWEKARYLGLGDGASVYDSTLLFGQVSVGEKTWIGPNCVLDGSGGLQIGSTCSIAAGCQLYSHDTVAWAVSGGAAKARHAETKIGDAVYIGPGTVVAAGSSIGEHSIIGALSLVKGDIPPYSFAAGSPAQIIGRVTVGPDGEVSVRSTPIEPITMTALTQRPIDSEPSSTTS